MPPILDYFASGRYIGDLNTGGEVAHELAQILYRMWTTNSVFLTPSALKYAIAGIDSQFLGTSQNDLEEFLHCLLNVLHEDTKLQTSQADMSQQGPNESDAEASAVELSNHSRIKEIFNLHTESVLECSCGTKSTSFEESFMLSLPIVQGHDLELMDCIRGFFESEQLAEGNEFFCPVCKHKVRALKQLHLIRAPPVLIVQLRRFDSTSGRKTKIYTHVGFPLVELDLCDLMGCMEGDVIKPVYDCIAVAVHRGNARGGHYYSLCRRNNRTWFNCNDGTVEIIDENDVVNNRDGEAYVLVYKRRDVGDLGDSVDVVRAHTAEAGVGYSVSAADGGDSEMDEMATEAQTETDTTMVDTDAGFFPVPSESSKRDRPHDDDESSDEDDDEVDYSKVSINDAVAPLLRAVKPLDLDNHASLQERHARETMLSVTKQVESPDVQGMLSNLTVSNCVDDALSGSDDTIDW